jgi:trehalose 6-phosphate phosphatase
MTPLFSDTGLQRLDRIAGPGLLCVFDFDGTLSPIVADPAHAVLPDAMQQRLLDLSVLAPVAIITGRAVPDLRPRLGFAPDFLVGNHGIEGVPGWELRAQEYQVICQGWARSVAQALRDPLRFDPHIKIEDKGYSMSVHYRLARDPALTEARLTELFAALTPSPRVVAGKCVFNLVPQGAPHKGSALEQLMHDGARSDSIHNAIYVGDDVTDEDVFRLQRPDVLTVRVEPGENSAAEFYVDRLTDVERLLDELIARLRQRMVRRSMPAAG